MKDDEYNKWFRGMVDKAITAKSYKFLGVDWCKGSGMVRGDVIAQSGNVTKVRFKTVTEIKER